MKKLKKKEEKNWILLDATDQILGRLATKISEILMGKNKVTYSRNKDNGDYVIVINTDKIAISGKKLEKKKYYTHSGYPGGLKVKSLKDIFFNNSTLILKKAVKGMLPKNKLNRTIIKKLKLYPNKEHLHLAQKVKIIKNKL